MLIFFFNFLFLSFFGQGRQAVGVVNSPNLARSMDDRNKPWMQLAQALGYLAYCLVSKCFSREIINQETSVELVGYGKQSGQRHVSEVSERCLVFPQAKGRKM